jgi:hypothetical protein
MSSSDDAEMHRPCELLADVDRSLPVGAPAREGLQKAAIALQLAFGKGLRAEVEPEFASIGLPLTDEQRARVVQLGLKAWHASNQSCSRGPFDGLRAGWEHGTRVTGRAHADPSTDSGQAESMARGSIFPTPQSAHGDDAQ